MVIVPPDTHPEMMAMQGMMGGHIQTEHWIVMELCTRGSLQVTQQEALNDAHMQHTQCLLANTPQKGSAIQFNRKYGGPFACWPSKQAAVLPETGRLAQHHVPDAQANQIIYLDSVSNSEHAETPLAAC